MKAEDYYPLLARIAGSIAAGLVPKFESPSQRLTERTKEIIAKDSIDLAGTILDKACELHNIEKEAQ